MKNDGFVFDRGAGFKKAIVDRVYFDMVRVRFVMVLGIKALNYNYDAVILLGYVGKVRVVEYWRHDFELRFKRFYGINWIGGGIMDMRRWLGKKCDW